jgi:hypothetical protein
MVTNYITQPKVRDTQRARTYAAELEALGGSSLTARLTLETLRDLAATLYASSWWGVTCPDVAPRLVPASPSAHRSSAHYASGAIRVAPYMETAATLCHESAHFVAPGGHSATFRAAHVEILRLLTDDSIASCLSGAYRIRGLVVASIAPAPALGLLNYATIR